MNLSKQNQTSRAPSVWTRDHKAKSVPSVTVICSKTCIYQDHEQTLKHAHWWHHPAAWQCPLHVTHRVQDNWNAMWQDVLKHPTKFSHLRPYTVGTWQPYIHLWWQCAGDQVTVVSVSMHKFFAKGMHQLLPKCVWQFVLTVAIPSPTSILEQVSVVHASHKANSIQFFKTAHIKNLWIG